MTLDELASLLPVVQRSGYGNPKLAGITHDSRAVQAGWIFAAIPGLKQDGLSFADDAVARGAAAILGEAPPSAPSPVPYLQVANARQALAAAAWALAGNPERKLDLIAVTGTNGKTTIATTLAYALNAMHIPCAVCGTLGISFPGEDIAGTRTTPEAADLAPALSQMVLRGVRACAMEATSIGIALDRVFKLPFSTAIFSNLTRDHLDFHGSWEAYRDAKLRLFRELSPESVAIINNDDEAARLFISAVPCRVLTYGIDRPADFKAKNVQLDHSGLTFSLHHKNQTYSLSAPLLGRFNVYNLLAVIAALAAKGHSPDTVLPPLRKAPGVRGRAEIVRSKAPFTVVVDYAHTPDALLKILASLRDLHPRRLITLIGAGGNRDRGKRPEMARAAETLSDIVYLTSDNPRDEEPEQILDEMAAGIENREIVHLNPDRRAAIHDALDQATKGDIVLIAGKGHETYQEIKGVFHDFDDRQVAMDWLRNAGFN